MSDEKKTIDVNNPPADEAGECPRCGKHRLWVGENRAFNALSRRDNKTYVCSPCGSDEAMQDFARMQGIGVTVEQEIGRWFHDLNVRVQP